MGLDIGHVLATHVVTEDYFLDDEALKASNIDFQDFADFHQLIPHEEFVFNIIISPSDVFESAKYVYTEPYTYEKYVIRFTDVERLEEEIQSILDSMDNLVIDGYTEIKGFDNQLWKLPGNWEYRMQYAKKRGFHFANCLYASFYQRQTQMGFYVDCHPGVQGHQRKGMKEEFHQKYKSGGYGLLINKRSVLDEVFKSVDPSHQSHFKINFMDSFIEGRSLIQFDW